MCNCIRRELLDRAFCNLSLTFMGIAIGFNSLTYEVQTATGSHRDRPCFVCEGRILFSTKATKSGPKTQV